MVNRNVTELLNVSIKTYILIFSHHFVERMHKLKTSQKDRCREFITLTQTGMDQDQYRFSLLFYYFIIITKYFDK